MIIEIVSVSPAQKTNFSNPFVFVMTFVLDLILAFSEPAEISFTASAAHDVVG